MDGFLFFFFVVSIVAFFVLVVALIDIHDSIKEIKKKLDNK